MLPRFLIADNSQELPDQIFVVHTQKPRFIVGSDIADFSSGQEIFWIDDAPIDKELIASLMKEAEEFLDKELDSQEGFLDGTLDEE